jgi:hypothetical protein
MGFRGWWDGRGHWRKVAIIVVAIVAQNPGPGFGRRRIDPYSTKMSVLNEVVFPGRKKAADLSVARLCFEN